MKECTLAQTQVYAGRVGPVKTGKLLEILLAVWSFCRELASGRQIQRRTARSFSEAAIHSVEGRGANQASPMATTPPATAFKKLRLSIQVTVAARQNILEQPTMHASSAIRKFYASLFLSQ